MFKEIDLNVTNKCQSKCLFCAFDSGYQYVEEISFETICKIVDEAREYNIEDIHITGGEPTLREDLEDIVEYILNSTNCNVRLITNGNYKDKQILKKLYDIGLRDIMFSVDGERKIHDFLRGNIEAYDNTSDSIKYAINQGYDVRVNMVANKANIDELKTVTLNTIEWGCKLFSVFLMSPIGRGKYVDELILTAEEWIIAINEYHDWYAKLDKKIPVVIEQGYLPRKQDVKIDYDMIEGRGNGCRQIGSKKDYIIIRADGKAFPCVFFVDTHHSVGDITRESLKDIYDKEWIFYKQLEEISSEECKKCNNSIVCNSGCRGYARFQHGDYLSKDSRCTDQYYPACPILKYNIYTGKINGSTEGVL